MRQEGFSLAKRDHMFPASSIEKKQGLLHCKQKKVV
jgi:hypothetical protein